MLLLCPSFRRYLAKLLGDRGIWLCTTFPGLLIGVFDNVLMAVSTSAKSALNVQILLLGRKETSRIPRGTSDLQRAGIRWSSCRPMSVYRSLSGREPNLVRCSSIILITASQQAAGQWVSAAGTTMQSLSDRSGCGYRGWHIKIFACGGGAIIWQCYYYYYY